MRLLRLISVVGVGLFVSAMEWSGCPCAKGVIEKKYDIQVLDSTPCPGAKSQCSCEIEGYQVNRSLIEPINPSIGDDLGDRSDAELKPLLRAALFKWALAHPYQDASFANKGVVACSLPPTVEDPDWTVVVQRVKSRSKSIEKVTARLKSTIEGRAELNANAKAELQAAVDAAIRKDTRVENSANLFYFHAHYSKSADGLSLQPYMQDCLKAAEKKQLPVVSGASGIWILGTKRVTDALGSASFLANLDAEIKARKLPAEARIAFDASLSVLKESSGSETVTLNDQLDLGWLRFSSVAPCSGRCEGRCETTKQALQWGALNSLKIGSCSGLIPFKTYDIRYQGARSTDRSNWLEYEVRANQVVAPKFCGSSTCPAGPTGVAATEIQTAADAEGRISVEVSGTMCSPSGSTCVLADHFLTVSGGPR